MGETGCFHIQIQGNTFISYTLYGIYSDSLLYNIKYTPCIRLITQQRLFTVLRWSYWHRYLGEVFADTVLHDGPVIEPIRGSGGNSRPPMGERGLNILQEVR